jgi:hypothetical protein
LPRELSKIICPVCGQFGGTLILRRAGNARNAKYFYIKHFSPSAKHKNTSCYIGRTYRLAYVKLNDKKYRAYENTVKSAYLYPQGHNQNMNLIIKAGNQLQHLGFPKKFVRRKLKADTAKAFLEKEYERLWGKGVLESANFGYERFNYELSWRVEKALGRIRK